MKMSDVFALPVSKFDTSRLLWDQSGAVINNLPNGNSAALHAINTHDHLVAKNERLKQELASQKLIDSDFTIGSLNQINEYIDEFGSDTDLDVVKAEIGELALRLKGEYL